MEALSKHLSRIRVPSDKQAIYKDECVYTFDNPESPTGLYVSLTSFLGFGEEYVRQYAEKSGNCVFLHIYREKRLKEDAEKGKDEAGPQRKITRLAIGIEGGYNDNDTKNYEYKNNYSIVVMPDIQTKIPFPNNDLPLLVTQSVETILAQESAFSKMDKEMFTGTWDGEERQISKFSENLPQLSNGKKIPYSGWKCEKCDLTNNLWLNLTDGSILCGRKFFDGSGGNDHAVRHYREFKYPLAVKLGTISLDCRPDVFSYPEDDMVIDPKLDEHLAHFGINIAGMKKCEKSMVELEIEINQRIGEWSMLTESDSELQPLSGPGYTGMRNMGNSCYINSVMQVIFTIPDFIKRFVGKGAEAYFNKFPDDPANDFDIQMSKLGNGLWSGKYSSITENSLDNTGISPAMFKNVVGKNHQDFGTKLQQDAYDFFLHFSHVLNRNSRKQSNPLNALTFSIEERLECMVTKKIQYLRREDFCIPLNIPLEKATNLDEVKEYLEKKANCPGGSNSDKDVVRHKILLQDCLDDYFDFEITDNYSPAGKDKITAIKNIRLLTMPDYLMMHVRKFTLTDDWLPLKLDVEVKMPDELDLSNWRTTGEKSLKPIFTKPDPSIKFVFDEDMVRSLMQMGFPPQSCRRAVYNTNNGGVELCVSWLMEHITDSDFSDPFVVPSASDRIGEEFEPNPESLKLLMNMGFDKCQATKALKATDGNVERATDWIFSHTDDMDTTESDESIASPQRKEKYRDGSGKYKMVAFISHMGRTAHVGHYVCHIKKDDQWVIFNDNKVALSQNPPKDMGYIYLYKREE